jgi:AraC family transcriptional regulator
MLLIDPTRQYDVDGISIQHGVQPAGRLSWTSKTNLLVVHLGVPVMFECSVNGRTNSRRAVPGDVHIIPQGTELDIQLSRPTELVVLTFDHGTVQAVARDVPTNGDLHLTFQFTLRDAQILSLVHTLQEELKSGCVTGESYVRQLGTALIRYVASRYSTRAQHSVIPSDGLPPNRLRFILDYIHSHLETRLGLAELASTVRMSPQHFANLFRRSTGRAPHEYVVHERIERAKRLLAETTEPLMDVAFEVGFANQSHFTDVFHRLTGMTPRRYRQRFEDPARPDHGTLTRRPNGRERPNVLSSDCAGDHRIS